MKRTRKRHLTLLETLIAVSLVSILLTIVFGFFRELSEINRMTEVQQKESFQMRYVETRLNYLFQRIVNENESVREGKQAYKRRFYFYTQSPEKSISESTSLIFSFNNGARSNPAFSDDLLARLYIDDKHRLCLAMWPIYSDKPHQEMQREVLLENVAAIHYKFYAAPERHLNAAAIQPGKVDTENKDPEKDHWHIQEWMKSYQQMPSIVNLTVKVANKPEDLQSRLAREIPSREITFAFVLPSSINYIYYPPG